MSRNPTPLEADEQKAFVAEMRRRGFTPMAVQNEQTVKGRNVFAVVKHQKAMGMEPGAPDVIMLEPSPRYPMFHIAIEMKRSKGGKVSPNQQRIHKRLKKRNWLVVVAYGCVDGLRQMGELGFFANRSQQDE